MRSTLFEGYDARFKVLFYGRLFAAMGWSLSMPFLAIYMSQDLNIDAALVTLAYTVAAIFGAVSQMIAGELADRVGRRVTLLASMAIRTVVFVLIALAVQLSLGFLSVAILMCASSISGNMFMPAANAMITDIVPASKRVEGFSIARIGANIGWAVGPALGGISSQFLSYPITFMITSVLSAVVLALVFFYAPESRMKGAFERFRPGDIAAIRKDRSFMIYAVLTILTGIIAMQMIATLSIYTQEYTPWITKDLLGVVYTLNGLLVVFLQFPVSRSLSKYRLTTMLSLGTLLYCIGYLSVAFASTFALLLISMTIVTLGEIVISPPSLTIVSNMAPSNKRGQYMGVYGLFDAFGGSFGPLVGGIAMDTFPGQPAVIWAIPCLFGLAAVVGYLFFGKHLSKEIDTGSL
jgi:MFS family permease